MITYIPCGTKNLAPIFPSIDFNTIEEYFLQIEVTEAIIVTTTKYIIDTCRDTDDVLRIHFLNSLGTIDAINLLNISQIHETKSLQYEKSLPVVYNKRGHALSRNAVSANDNFLGYAIIQENEAPYYEELFDSPLAWLENGDDYIPIIIEDAKMDKIKFEDRYAYEINLPFRLSKEKIIIKN